MTQLSLIDTPSPWRLDEHTREVGRAGIARARAALCAGLAGPGTDTGTGPAPERPASGRGHPTRPSARRQRRHDRPAAA